MYAIRSYYVLNSKSNLFPDGLGNHNGLVGKNFMVHPNVFINGVFEEVMDSHLGPMGSPLYSQEFYETDESRGFARGYMFHVERVITSYSIHYTKLYDKDDNHVKELLMFVNGLKELTKGQDITINGQKREIETVLLSLTGDIDLRQISKLTNKMNMPGGDQLKKVNEKN